MSRGVRDLRDLICISRLTVRDSDDDDQPTSDEDIHSPIQTGRKTVAGTTDLTNATGDSSVTPDSGFVTSAIQLSDSTEDDLKQDFPSPDTSGVRKQKKWKTHARPQLGLQRLPTLPGISTSSSGDNLSSRPANRTLTAREIFDRAVTPSVNYSAGNYEELLMYVDGSVVSDWLEQANSSIAELTSWCLRGDNFVRFSHFWLSDFSDLDKFNIFRLEYKILGDQLSFAFAPGCSVGEVKPRHLSMFLEAVLREYPARLLSSRGAHLFLDYLDTLSSGKKDVYRRLLSDVKCSTRVPQHIQWILAIRSFALVSLWSAVISFYRSLFPNADDSEDASTPRNFQDASNVNLERMLIAIRNGFTDVVHYLLRMKKVSASVCDEHQRSLLFHAVLSKQIKVIRFLLNNVSRGVDVNHPADSGNTPLHAAANHGDRDVVELLCKSRHVVVDTRNRQCDGATPLHLAVMHGHRDILSILLAAGADPTLTMGSLTAVDIARDFDQHDLLDLLAPGEVVMN